MPLIKVLIISVFIYTSLEMNPQTMFLVGLIKESFKYGNETILLVKNGNYPEIVDEALCHANYATLKYDFRRVNEIFSFPIDGYIIALSDAEQLRHLFNLRRFQLRPYNKALILLPDLRDDIDWESYVESSGLHVVLIQNFNVSEEISKKQVGKIKASVFDCEPFIHLDKDKRVKAGLEHDIIAEIFKNIEYTVHEDERVSLYTKVLTDSIDMNTDISMCSQWQSVLAKTEVDISFPYTQMCITFLVHKPQLLPNSAFVYKPFKIEVWLVICAIHLLIFAITRTIKQIYRLYTITTKSNSYLLVLQVLVLQGIKFPQPKFGALRFLVTSWLITTVLLSTYYAAGFTSTLTSPVYSKPINTLENMVEEGIYWGGPDFSNMITLEGSTKSAVLEILNNYIIEENYQVINERLRTKKYAKYVKKFMNIDFITNTDYLDSYGKNHLKVLQECAAEYFMVFALPKASPYTALLNSKIQAFSAHGLIDYWTTKALSGEGFKYMRNFFKITGRLQIQPLNMIQMQGAFYLLLTGLVISLIAFIREYTFRQSLIPNK